jgi:predicted DNA-binding transcriptional regulator AlpA
MNRGKALSSQEVMDRLGIKRQTFDRLRDEDDHFIVYRAGRTLRMDESDLEAWVQRQKKAEQAERGKDINVIA